jgi:hypothetical protein
MNLTPEQLFTKIGILVMENDTLRAEIGKLQQEKVQREKELKKGNEGAKVEKK